MKSKALLVKTGDIVLTDDVTIEFLNMDWPLFVVVGQHYYNASSCAACGKMMYDVVPAHIDNGSIVFDILDEERIAIEYGKLRLIIGKANHLRNNDMYYESLEKIIPSKHLRENIYALENKELIAGLVSGIDQFAHSELPPRSDEQIRVLFRTTFQRDMDADAAQHCIDYITKLGKDEICNLYKLNWSEYMNTLKHLKDIIKKSLPKQE